LTGQLPVLQLGSEQTFKHMPGWVQSEFIHACMVAGYPYEG